MSPLPLDDVIVVAVEQAVAAPFATRQLADLGARVIKVERPESGDFARGYDRAVSGTSSAFVWLGRGKESVALDLKNPSGRQRLEQLLARADVFVHNLSPAAAERAGLDPAAVQKRHPAVIACAVSGYGTTGPLAEAKAYDLLVQGETGLISLTGTGEQMAKVGISIADIAAGMYTYSSILAALRHRDRTGIALPVEISLFDALTEWLAYPLYYTRYGGSAPKRQGTSHATIAPYGAFTTGDGHEVLLAVQNDREWLRFCADVLGDPKLASDERFDSHHARVQNRSVLDALIARRFEKLDREAVLNLLATAEIAHARLNEIGELADHEQLVSRNRWEATGIPGGEVETLVPPWVPHGRVESLGGVPALGEHTQSIFAWLDETTSADIA
jgi:formyl-CoA transferase